MSDFWKLRLVTLCWGFAVAWWFTGRIDLTSKIFITQAVGNTVWMWLLTRKSKRM